MIFFPSWHPWPQSLDFVSITLHPSLLASDGPDMKTVHSYFTFEPSFPYFYPLHIREKPDILQALYSSLYHVSSFQSPIHPPTSLEGTLDPFLRDHQLSTMAMRQESTTPAARTQKTPAKLWMSRALPRCRVWTEL